MSLERHRRSFHVDTSGAPYLSSYPNKPFFISKYLLFLFGFACLASILSPGSSILMFLEGNYHLLLLFWGLGGDSTPQPQRHLMYITLVSPVGMLCCLGHRDWFRTCSQLSLGHSRGIWSFWGSYREGQPSAPICVYSCKRGWWQWRLRWRPCLTEKLWDGWGHWLLTIWPSFAKGTDVTSAFPVWPDWCIKKPQFGSSNMATKTT